MSTMRIKSWLCFKKVNRPQPLLANRPAAILQAWKTILCGLTAANYSSVFNYTTKRNKYCQIYTRLFKMQKQYFGYIKWKHI